MRSIKHAMLKRFEKASGKLLGKGQENEPVRRKKSRIGGGRRKKSWMNFGGSKMVEAIVGGGGRVREAEPIIPSVG